MCTKCTNHMCVHLYSYQYILVYCLQSVCQACKNKLLDAWEYKICADTDKLVLPMLSTVIKKQWLDGQVKSRRIRSQRNCIIGSQMTCYGMHHFVSFLNIYLSCCLQSLDWLLIGEGYFNPHPQGTTNLEHTAVDANIDLQLVYRHKLYNYEHLATKE